jgi:Uma2 family endonuclease
MVRDGNEMMPSPSTRVARFGHGQCFPDNTGFQLPGLVNTVRSPDAAFVRRDKLPAVRIGPGWMKVAPDLVVEVRSPDESRRELDERLHDYQVAGTRHRWIIDPDSRTVLLTSDDLPDRRLRADGVIDNVEVLPGFTLEVAKLFVGLAK